MKTIYDVVDNSGRSLQFTYEDGEIKVTMIFRPEKGLTVEEVCETMEWNIVNATEYEEPKVIPFKRKEL